MLELLTSDDMRKAEAATIKNGTAQEMLMERAGTAVAAGVMVRWAPCPVLVLCGPGNNGGDGKIAARILAQKGWPVRIENAPLAKPPQLEGIKLVIDAVFGTGLARPLDPVLARTFTVIADQKIPVVAVDVPSGMDATTGAIDPATPHCVMTITFCRKKTGHMLLPGRTRCGRIEVADIGISDQTVSETGAHVFENHLSLWLNDFPLPDTTSHKYRRGHALVLGGSKMTGAARLAGIAAARMGAGVVTLAVPENAFNAYSTADTPSLIIEPMKADADFAALLNDPKRHVALLGPGSGISDSLRAMTRAALATQKPCVLDADALSAFAGRADDLKDQLSHAILTPHEGEFERFFGVITGSKLERAREASRRCGGIVLLKGADTVIAAPDGTAVINGNAPPTLATAGAGDVLAGMILGLLAQKMPPFQAACAAAWLHGAAALGFGPGLIATDLLDMLPVILNSLFSKEK